MRVNRGLIYSINKNGWLTHLSVFIYLKGLRKNSCIFNYNPAALSAKTGLSESSIRKYIKFFLKKGWCRMDGENLIFNKINKIGWQMCQSTCKINSKTVKEIKRELYLNLIKHKVDQSKWYTQTCLDLQYGGEIKKKQLNRMINKWEKRTGKRFSNVKGLSMLNEIGDKKGFKLSFRKIAQWLHVGIATAHKVINDLKKHKMIDVMSGHIAYSERRLAVADGMFVSKKGNSVKVDCNRYVFN